MNNTRRREIKKAIKVMDFINVNNNFYDVIDKITDILNDVLWEEEMAFDNMPDGLKDSYRGMKMEENVGILYDIIDDLNDLLKEEKLTFEILKKEFKSIKTDLDDVITVM